MRTWILAIHAVLLATIIGCGDTGTPAPKIAPAATRETELTDEQIDRLLESVERIEKRLDGIEKRLEEL